MLNKVKLALRIGNDEYDTEITMLINAAKKDLELAGIASSNIDTSDDGISQAIIYYCKANFGFDNSESQRINNVYQSFKQNLVLAQEYNKEQSRW